MELFRIVSLRGSWSPWLAACVLMGLSIRLSQKLGGAWMGVWVGILLLFQPEVLLYSTSSLREPLYTALILGVLAWLSQHPKLFALRDGCIFRAV